MRTIFDFQLPVLGAYIALSELWTAWVTFPMNGCFTPMKFIEVIQAWEDEVS